MQAAARPQAAFDYDFERQVMQEEASTSATSFMAMSEVGSSMRQPVRLPSAPLAAALQPSGRCMQGCMDVDAAPPRPCPGPTRITTHPPQASYYKDTGVDKFLSMGFSVAAVSLAVAYQASHGGDQNQVRRQVPR